MAAQQSLGTRTKKYLASSDSEEKDTEELKSKYRYRALLNLGGKTRDMEIKYFYIRVDRGYEGNEKEPGNDETTIDKYKHKGKGRMKARKMAYEAKKGVDINGAKDTIKEQIDLGFGFKFDDPFFQEEEEPAVTKKAVSGGNMMHFNINEVAKAEKEKRKRGKKAADAEGVQVGFDADVKDPRFAALFEEYDFAIDPTNPRFKQTSTMKKPMEGERNRKKGQGNNGEDGANRKKWKSEAQVGDDVSRLVQRKSQSK